MPNAHVVDCSVCRAFSTKDATRNHWWDELVLGAPADNLLHAFALWLQAVEATNASPKTVVHYEGRCRQFIAYLESQDHEAPFALALLGPEHARRASIWVREHSAGKRGGEAAARALVGTLKTASAWLADEDVLLSDPLSRLRRPRVAHVARTPFAENEVRSLVQSAAGSLMGARDVAIIHLLLDTGMRVGGLCSIMLEDVNLRDRRLELRLKGGRRQALYFGSAQRDGGRTVRALRAWLAEREGIARRYPTRHQGRLLLSRDGWPMKEAGVRSMLERLAAECSVANVHPHRFRHTMATWYLVRHPGDETGLRGILGHLSDEMYKTYVHISHELIAQRAGRTSLAEAWLGGGDQEDAGVVVPAPHQPAPGVPDLRDLTAALKSDPELRKLLLQALVGA